MAVPEDLDLPSIDFGDADLPRIAARVTVLTGFPGIYSASVGASVPVPRHYRTHVVVEGHGETVRLGVAKWWTTETGLHLDAGIGRWVHTGPHSTVFAGAVGGWRRGVFGPMDGPTLQGFADRIQWADNVHLAITLRLSLGAWWAGEYPLGNILEERPSYLFPDVSLSYGIAL